MAKIIIPLCLILFTSLYSAELTRTPGTVGHKTIRNDAPQTQEKLVEPARGSSLSGEDIEPKQLFTDSSFLYDASQLKINSTPYFPLPHHLLLAAQAATIVSETVGSYSYVVFYKKDGVIKERNFIVSDVFTQGKFDKDNLHESVYNTYLRLLEEHCPPDSTDLCNIFATMLNMDESSRRSSCQGLYHAEQRMLIDMRYSLLKIVVQLLKDNAPQEIMSICVNLHSTQDVCGKCGPTIEHVLSILRKEVVDCFSKAQTALKSAEGKKEQPKNIALVKPFGECVLADTFSFFATVSSSSSYRTGYLKRPDSSSEEAIDYFTKYTQNQDIRRGRLDIANLDRKALYFWVPGLKDVQVTKEENGLNVKVQHVNSLSRFRQLIEVTLDKDRCPESITAVSLPEGIEISTRSDNSTLMNPRIIEQLTHLRSLDIARTNARSAYLCNMFTPLTLLVSLNLNGAIVHYRDDDSPQEEPKRTKLFKALGKLPALTQIDAQRNNIFIHELCIWLDDSSAMLKIKRLNLANNRIFDTTEDAVDKVKSLVEKFIGARSNPKIILGASGTVPKGWSDIYEENIDELSQNSPQQQGQPKNLTSAGAAQPSAFNTPFDMTDKEVELFCNSRNKEENKKIREVVRKKWERKSAKYKEVEKWAEEYKKTLTK